MRKKPFIFDTKLSLVVVTGIKVHSLHELRAALPKVADSSIFFHTNQEYLVQNYQQAATHNGFARWVSQTLREEASAERLAAIELLAFTTIRKHRRNAKT